MREWPERAGLKVGPSGPQRRGFGVADGWRGSRGAAMHRRCLARPCSARPPAFAGVIVVRGGFPLRVRGCLRADSGRRAGPGRRGRGAGSRVAPLGGVQEGALLGASRCSGASATSLAGSSTTCLEGRNLGPQIRLRSQSLDINARSIMLCRLPEGIRERVGLLVGEASIGQATGNRVSIEHEGMPTTKVPSARRADDASSQVSSIGHRASVSGRSRPSRTVRWNPLQDVGNGGGNGSSHTP